MNLKVNMSHVYKATVVSSDVHFMIGLIASLTLTTLTGAPHDLSYTKWPNLHNYWRNHTTEHKEIYSRKCGTCVSYVHYTIMTIYLYITTYIILYRKLHRVVVKVYSSYSLRASLATMRALPCKLRPQYLSFLRMSGSLRCHPIPQVLSLVFDFLHVRVCLWCYCSVWILLVQLFLNVDHFLI